MTTENYQTPDTDEAISSEEDRMMAVLAYIPILCLLPYLKRDRSEFVSKHVRLGMTLFVIEIGAIILRFRFVWDIVLLACIVAAILGIVHVFQGKSFYIPYVSDLFSKKR